MSRGALTATAALHAEPGPGGQRVRWSQAWPVVLRRTGDRRVHLVHGAGGPLGGDAFTLKLTLAPGAALGVGSAGATVVQPGAPAPARWSVLAEVGPGAVLDWAPEPTVVCDGAALAAALRVAVAAGGGAVLREVVVLGRHGQRGGRYTGTLDVTHAQRPLLCHRSVLDGADEELCGPAGTAGAHAVGTLVLAGTAAELDPPGPADAAGEDAGLRWAWSELAGAGRVLMAVGEPRAVTELVSRQAALAHQGSPCTAAG